MTLSLLFGGEGAPLTGGVDIGAVSYYYSAELTYTYDPAPVVPLPATLPMLLSGLGLGWWLRRKAASKPATV